MRTVACRTRDWLVLSLALGALLLSAQGCRSIKTTGTAPATHAREVGTAGERDSQASVSDRTTPGEWRLGVQAYTFRKFTFFETLDALAFMGIGYVEAYPGQRVSDDIEGNTHHSMDPATREKVLAKLDATGVKLVGYGVVRGNSEEDWKRIFAFAKSMGIDTITTEPEPESLDLVDRLADRYQVNVAFHNHAKPSRYWNPEAVLDACNGRSPRLGACADNGHWIRSELDPVACLKTLRGRLTSLHLKDVNTVGNDAHCVPFGSGVCDLPAVFAELKQQGFSGLLSLEYEHEPGNPKPGLAQCITYAVEAQRTSAEDLRSGRFLPPGMAWDVADVWKDVTPDREGRWEVPGIVDTSGYIDTTDDGKGRILASGEGFPNEHPPNAFDNTDKSKWCIKAPTAWIQYEYPGESRHRVEAYTITSANDASPRDPRDWQLLGSDDGEQWDVLDAREGEGFLARFQKRLFKVQSPGEYHTYKLDVTRNHGTDTSQLAEIELLAPKPPESREPATDGQH